MAKLSTDELLETFKEMTLIELSEFVKEFETVFDVKAAAPVAAAGPAAAAPSTSSSRLTVARRSRSSRLCVS
jgi:large subunit ribosomal protein L7/L12